MQSYGDLTSRDRELSRFYGKIRQQIVDFDLRLDVEPSSLRRPADVPDKQMFGKITKDEFEKILVAYERQTERGDEKPVTCAAIAGKSYAKLLHSKPGFHHPGSTSHLIKDLGIKDVHRNSFLAGHSTYSLRDNESLRGLRKQHNRLLVKPFLRKAKEYMDIKDLKSAKEQIDEALKVDRNNADALAMRGSYYAAEKKFDNSIRDFEDSLRNRPDDLQLVKFEFSKVLCDFGLRCFMSEQIKRAYELFDLAIKYNERNESAILHLGLCNSRLSNQRQFSNAPLYRK